MLGFCHGNNIGDAVETVGAPTVDTLSSVVDAGKGDEDAWGAAKGGEASGRRLAAKGREDHHKWATSWLVRLLARESPMSLMEGGGGGRRLVLAGRWLATRVLVHKHSTKFSSVVE